MPYSFHDIEKRLKKLGFSAVRQKGSHVLFSDGKKIFPVPNHGGKDISPGVEKKIIGLLGLTKDEFDNIKIVKRATARLLFFLLKNPPAFGHPLYQGGYRTWFPSG